MQKIKTEHYEPYIKDIYIDDRENTRIDYAMEQYAPFNPSIHHLDVGDYIFGSYPTDKRFLTFKSNIFKPTAEYVVFEYKEANDFLSSIENHRLENQVYHMVTNFNYTFVMVLADDLRETMQELYYSTGIDMSLAQVDGAIAEFTTSSTVVFAQSQYQAFDLMLKIAGKIFQHKPIRYKYGRKSTNSALNYLSAIKGLDKKADIICRHCELRSLKDLMELDKSRLMEVKGVGEKLADKVLGELHGLQDKD